MQGLGLLDAIFSIGVSSGVVCGGVDRLHSSSRTEVLKLGGAERRSTVREENGRDACVHELFAKSSDDGIGVRFVMEVTCREPTRFRVERYQVLSAREITEIYTEIHGCP